MDGNPPDGGRATAEERSSSPAGAREATPAERFGPLALRRMPKDDGRSLIVYEHVEAPPQSVSGEPGERA